MTLPIDFTFDYEKPNATRRGRMRTPVRVYIQEETKTGGILFISTDWLNKQRINADEIALQVKGSLDTYVVFNPPKNAPRFKTRPISPAKNTMAYSCTESVRKIIETFSPNKTYHEMWLEKVGTFNEAIVFRLRNICETDELYNF
jgi:hypothetical protein